MKEKPNAAVGNRYDVILTDLRAAKSTRLHLNANRGFL
jgi:hypothetical protein